MNEVKINEAREHYRPVAVRSSLLYFIMNDLNKINPMYQFSLKVTNSTFLFNLTFISTGKSRPVQMDQYRPVNDQITAF